MIENGLVFYRGPSMLDGRPIIAVMTGLASKSANTKTADLFQTWIMREDVNPIEANRTGQDVSICGSCPHMGTPNLTKAEGTADNRTCYVRLDTAPNNVWKSYHRGIYPEMQVGEARERMAKRTKRVRGGSYGDPAAVPYWVWYALLDLGNDESDEAGNAYTHQWRRFPELATFCMASVDNESEYHEAKMLGFRPFRVRGPDDPMLEGEVPCPASEEMGHKTTCDLCQACKGNRAKTKRGVTIIVHGNGKGNYNET